MRFVNRSYLEEDAPPHLRDMLGIRDFDRVLAGDKSSIKSEIYRGDKSTEKTSKVLARYYERKCAYCENDEHEPQVEHYRPTGRSNKDGGHGGYPWLCYEWSNLLPSCAACNRTGAKGTRFPVMGDRIVQYERTTEDIPDRDTFRVNHPYMLAERPMLLHPEIDDPKCFFKFDSEGRIFGIDDQGRGEKTKEVCDLCRLNLRCARQRIVDDILNRIRNHIILLEMEHLDENGFGEALRQIFAELHAKTTDPKVPFTLFRWYFFEHFPTLFSEGFVQKYPKLVDYKESILNLYNRFCQSRP